MIFLFYLLSTIMIAGGIGLSAFGFDQIRTESGATMALAGVALTCAGLILSMLTAMLSELRKLRRVVEEPDPIAHPGTHGSVQPPAPTPSGPLPPLPPVRAPLPPGAMPPPPPGMTPPDDIAPETLSAAERLRRDKQANASEAAGHQRDHDSPVAHEGWYKGPQDAAHHGPSTPVVLKPADVRPNESGQNGPNESSSISDGQAPGTGSYATEAGDSKPPSPSGERTLSATHSSGGKTFFMFSDGSIETETNDGRYRFGSMQELRRFLEDGTGGERLSGNASGELVNRNGV